MKSILSIFLLAVLSVLISCKGKKASKPTEKEINEILGRSITYSEAKDMFDIYLAKSTRGRPSSNIDESRSVWFSVKELQTFLDGVFTAGQQNSIDEDSIGVRIYFGVYPDVEGGHYRRQQTMFLVGTEYINSGGKKIKHDMVFKHENKIVGIDPYNNGTLCPPNSCDGQEF